MIQKMALIASIILPLCNIPLIVRMIRRRSSQDVSLAWALGVWICLGLMVPSGLVSQDIVWKVFSVSNFALFSVVAITVLFFHGRKD